jgi:hypothetical protein
MIGNYSCHTVEIHTVCGKQARRIAFQQWKAARRLRMLKRLIREVRQLRRQVAR